MVQEVFPDELNINTLSEYLESQIDLYNETLNSNPSITQDYMSNKLIYAIAKHILDWFTNLDTRVSVDNNSEIEVTDTYEFYKEKLLNDKDFKKRFFKNIKIITNEIPSKDGRTSD